MLSLLNNFEKLWYHDPPTGQMEKLRQRGYLSKATWLLGAKLRPRNPWQAVSRLLEFDTTILIPGLVLLKLKGVRGKNLGTSKGKCWRRGPQTAPKDAQA